MPGEPHADEGRKASALDALDRNGGNVAATARETGVNEKTLRGWRKVRDAAAGFAGAVGPQVADYFAGIRENADGTAVVTATSFEPVRTLADAIKAAEVDLEVWSVDRWEASQWTTPLNVKQGQTARELKDGKGQARTELGWEPSVPLQQQQYRVRLYLRRLKPDETSVRDLIDQLRRHRFKLPAYHPPKANRKRAGRALEVSVMDPHLGMHCFKPQSDATWSLDECERLFMGTVTKLLDLAGRYGPFDEVVTAFGNDYLHADNIAHETTGGTSQPEMMSLHETYLRGKKLGIWMAERLRRVAPVVRILHVPGNHDRVTSFTLAVVLQAFYEGAGARDVTVDASPSPYKFWQYGANLIGFEHGHSVKPVRLAALMANETRLRGWADARYCEWHLGDQHRKGSGKPSMHEEQGVSVEYLPALTPPNEWHRLKSFNWQKRGAMAFVYDKAAGPVARLQVNFDNYTGGFMGDG